MLTHPAARRPGVPGCGAPAPQRAAVGRPAPRPCRTQRSHEGDWRKGHHRGGGACGVGRPVVPRGQRVACQAAKAVLETAEAVRVTDEAGRRAEFPDGPGVYGVYDQNGKLQYVGMSRKISSSVSTHAENLPELTCTVRYKLVESSTREALTAAWQEWVQAAVQESGEVPPGNTSGNRAWSTRRAGPPKQELKLTPGKGLQDLTCSVEDLIDSVVKSNKVVAFIKGTRTAPQCGFSHKVLTLLNECRADYEVVNVLDEHFNPGLRDAIKAYSQWPTIPQVYINGEFVGGADVVEEMHAAGELKTQLAV